MPRLLSLLSAGLLLASCGPEPLNLPSQPIDRAATCGVIAAIQARAATADIKAPLPFEAQERILHFALLAGAEGEEFAQEKANAVIERMSELQEAITGGKWQDLVPACRNAFPQAQVAEVKLPRDRVEAQLQCDELADFLTTALQSQEQHYAARLNDYQEVGRKLNQRLGPGLRARVGSDLDAQKEARRKARAAAAKVGPPSAVMKLCVERYG